MKTDNKLLSSASHFALVAGVTVSLSAFTAVSANAQQAPAQPESDAAESIVTAPLDVQGQAEGYATDHLSSAKQTAPLLDTPQTITVVPQEVIKEQGARNLTEILRNTPGISYNAGENGFGTTSNNFQMRGFDASGDIFIDGSRDSGSYTRDAFNVERVEVFKGPAADNGRGSAGGYVNIETKTPGLRNFINADVSYGFDEYDSEDRRRATVDVNQAINETTAVRLNALIEDSGVPGREHAEAKAWGFAPSVAFGLGREFRTVLSYEHVERNDLPDWGVPGAAYADLNGANPDGQATYDPTLAGLPRDNFYGLSSDFDDVTSDVFLARFEYDLSSNATISNQTRYSVVDRTARYTVPAGNAGAGVIDTQTQAYDRENTTLSNLTNVSLKFATGSLRHNLSTGIELTKEESEAGRFGTVNSPTNAFNPNPDRIPGMAMVPTSTSEVEVRTVAAYLYDTVEFNPQWQVTGGVRAERYEAEINSSTADFSGSTRYEESDTLFGGKIGLVFKPATNGSLYVSYGISQDPYGSFLSNPDISRTGGNAFPGLVLGAKPIESHNYEVGTKWDVLDEKLSLTAALFHTVKKNVPIAANSTTLLGYGEQVVEGLELGAAGKITEEWNVFAGAVFMDSERKLSGALDQALADANRGDRGCPALPAPCTVTVDGDELAFTPNVTANLWTTYRFPIGLTLGGGVRYVGSSYLGRPDDALRVIPNDRFGKMPSYVVFDAMVSYEVNENVNLRLNIENIADETYVSSSNWNGRRVQLGNPRTFILTTSFNF